MFARLYSVKYIPVAIAVYLSLLLCIYHLWYSSDSYASIGGTHWLRNSFDADEVWLQPYYVHTETNQHQSERIIHWKAASHMPNTLPKIIERINFTHGQFIAISSTRVHVEGYETQYFTWHEARRWKQPQDTSSNTVVIFEHCAHSDDIVTFSNIYAYHDSIASCAAQLARLFPAAILVYIVPKALISTTPRNATQDRQHQKDSRNRLELKLLHSHLSHNYLVRTKGLLVARSQRAMQTREHYLGDGSHTRTLRFLDLQISEIASSIALSSSFASTTSENKSAFAHLVEFQHTKLFAAAPSLHSRCAKYYWTRKYNPQCHPPSALTHPFLVTGLGGAGTHYAARQLRQQGWRVLHENLDSDGAVSWIYAANDWSVQMDYPYGALPPGDSSFLQPRFGHVIHLVRSPLDQISSFTAHSNKTYNFVLRTMELYLLRQHPVRGNDTARLVERFQKARADQHRCHRGGNCHLAFAALSWLHWNRFVQSFADATFRVDQVSALQEHVCQLASAASRNSTLPLNPLMKRHRYCEIKDCPSVNEGSKSNSISHVIDKFSFDLFNRALGVCALNEALFRRSAVHKQHQKYTWDDIAGVDPHVVREIQADAVKYGFKLD